MPYCWIGVDGTRTGWVIFVWKSDETYELWHVGKLSELELLINTLYKVQCIALDIPLGLLQVAQRGGRGCDREARRLLSFAKRNGKKATNDGNNTLPLVGPSSIFTPPCRIALAAFYKGGSHTIVSTANIESVTKEDGSNSRQGLGLSIQTYHILPKIVEADEFVIASPNKGATITKVAFFKDSSVPVIECHPELAFLALSQKTISNNDDKSSSLEDAKGFYSKKTIHGRRQRLELLCKEGSLQAQKLLSFAKRESSVLNDRQSIIDHLSSLTTWKIPSLLSSQSKRDGNVSLMSVAADDVLDAIVCASSSRRWSLGQAKMIKEEGKIPCDNRNLPMVIWV